MINKILCFFGVHDFKQVGKLLAAETRENYNVAKFTFLSIDLRDLGIKESFDIVYCTRCQTAVMKRTTEGEYG